MSMKKILVLFVCSFFLIGVVSSQKVFEVKYESHADVTVKVVDYESHADLLVYKVDYESEAQGNKGKWHFVDYESNADFSVYFTEYDSHADLKIYYVNYNSRAKWRNTSKKSLLE